MENNKIDELSSGFFLKGINDVSTERLRQITEEGYGSSRDDSLHGGALGAAGACYAMHAAWNISKTGTGETLSGTPVWWPFDPSSWKPEDARRNFVKAAALIIAEIDKIDRKEVGNAKDPETPE